MNLYNYLKETEVLNDIKQSLKSPIQKANQLIGEYVLIIKDEDRGRYLDDIEEQLNFIVKILEGFGYNYQPEQIPDEPEEVFKNILNKYKDEWIIFYNKLSKDTLNSFNSQTRYIINLIEIHRTNFIDEGEVLIDTDI